MKTGFKILTLAFIAVSAQAFAGNNRLFHCTTQLDYAIWTNNRTREIKTIDLEIVGEKSETNTLVRPLSVRAGSLMTSIPMAARFLSDDVFVFEGSNNRDGVTLSFSFMRNSDGSQNSTNSASVTVSRNGNSIKATNEVMDDVTKSYPVNCTLE